MAKVLPKVSSFTPKVHAKPKLVSKELLHFEGDCMAFPADEGL